MKMKAKAVAMLVMGATLLAGAVSATQAQTFASLSSSSEAIASVGDAKPLPAWNDFCRRYPAECLVDRSEPAMIDATPKVLQTLSAINRKVNTTIQPMSDEDHWGVPDRWDIPSDGFGDCEDFQLMKRKLLADAGLPRRAMRMTVVIDEKNEGHAVLMVKTNQGDLILDNKTDAVLTWAQTGYVFVKRESQDATAWVSLGRATSPTSTANRR